MAHWKILVEMISAVSVATAAGLLQQVSIFMLLISIPVLLLSRMVSHSSAYRELLPGHVRPLVVIRLHLQVQPPSPMLFRSMALPVVQMFLTSIGSFLLHSILPELPSL